VIRVEGAARFLDGACRAEARAILRRALASHSGPRPAFSVPLGSKARLSESNSG
jgi:hypothetical protein